MQICDKTEEDVFDGKKWIPHVKLAPSNVELLGSDVRWVNDKLVGELFVSPEFRDNEQAIKDMLLHKAARVGDQVFPDLWMMGYTDGRYAVLLSFPSEATQAILRGETPDVPIAKNLKIEFSPSQEAPNQLRLKVSNTGQIPLTLCWGNDGTLDNPANDPMLSLSATRDGKAVPPNPNPLPAGTLGLPFTLKPGESRERLIFLDDYLAFGSPGTFQVSAHYTIQIQNPDSKNGPKSWSTGTDAKLDVPIVHEAK